MAKEKKPVHTHEELQEHWFDWWEEDDGFNIKAGARQDRMDIFFMPDKEDEADPEGENTMKPLNKYIDHTLLKPEATLADMEKPCREAKEYDFYAVCVNSCYVSFCKELLKGSNVKLASVIGFPLGAMATAAKAAETECACRDGADEIDMVLSIGALKEGRFSYVQADMEAVVKAAAPYGSIVKVILETGLLTDDEIVKACQLAEAAGAAFVKTSTGFGHGGATEHHVALMKQTVGDRLQVKASGGIRDKETALAMIAAGADRIGASAGIAICSK